MNVQRLFPLVFVLVALLVAPACAGGKLPDDASAILDKATEIELYSLDPERLIEKPKNHFHGWKVLGKTTLKQDDRARALEAIRKGIADSDGKVAGCFNPRHGIRAKHDSKTVDLVLCFECLSLQVHGPGKQSSVLTTASPQPVLDKLLKDAGVKLAGKPK
jgi:hypothetical protein